VSTGAARRGSTASLVIITLIVLGIGTWVFLNSAFFSIQEVRVQGSRAVSTEDVRGLSGVELGDNLIALATKGVEERLERDPWIESAEVERDLPRTVVITVVERRPAGWLEDPEGFVVVAGDGTILERPVVEPQRLPALGTMPDAVEPGEGIDSVAVPLRVTSSMDPRTLREIAAVTIQGLDVALELRGGGGVVYGPATDIRAKNRALGDMLRWAAREGLAIESIDVRVPSAPSLAPAHGPSISPSFP
jgi:cell division septal protein FtsQ